MDEGATQSQSSNPGARLAAAREHAGMTLQQAAESLRLDVATLQALEAGRFQTLGAAVFVRGHLRHYAELVGLPVGEIDAAYEACSAQLAPLPDLRRTTTLPGTPASRGVALPPRAALIGAIVLVLIGTGLVGDARADRAAPCGKRRAAIVGLAVGLRVLISPAELSAIAQAGRGRGPGDRRWPRRRRRLDPSRRHPHRCRGGVEEFDAGVQRRRGGEGGSRGIAKMQQCHRGQNDGAACDPVQPGQLGRDLRRAPRDAVPRLWRCRIRTASDRGGAPARADR